MNPLKSFGTRLLTLLFAAACLAAASLPRHGALTLTPVLSGLSSPVYVTNAHDGTNRLFIVEQAGRIKVLAPGATTPTVYLDIVSKVLSTDTEQGLLGLAFHPQFATNARFFVNYTRKPDGATVVAEYHAFADPVATAASESVILVIPQPQPNHNGGMIEFGNDGFLYIGTGDGGGSNDPQNRAQNKDDLLGKMLRIDIDQPANGNLYSSPAGNPYAGATPGRDEIYALGLRNPYRFSFDSQTGQLYVGDVGKVRSRRSTSSRPAATTAGASTKAAPARDSTPGSATPTTSCRRSPIRSHRQPLLRHRRLCVSRHGGTMPLGTYVFADFCGGRSTRSSTARPIS
jgi:glucose/arabinose dehydrogenase